MVKVGVSPEVNALATVFIGAVSGNGHLPASLLLVIKPGPIRPVIRRTLNEKMVTPPAFAAGATGAGMSAAHASDTTTRSIS